MDRSRYITYSTINLPSKQTVSNKIQGAGRNTFIAGLNLLTTIKETVELELNYDFQWNDLYTNHGFYLQVGIDF